MIRSFKDRRTRRFFEGRRVAALSVPAARIASRRLPAGAAGALVFRFDVDAQALAAVQLEALTTDGQRLTAWPSSSSTREAKRLTHGRLRGAYLQLPAPEATALVLVEGPVDALAARWLHPGTVEKGGAT